MQYKCINVWKLQNLLTNNFLHETLVLHGLHESAKGKDFFFVFDFQFPVSILGLTSVPSLSTLEGVKKYISEMGNAPSAIAPKQTVMLDWVSKEDGTHLLTITVGNKVKFDTDKDLLKAGLLR